MLVYGTYLVGVVGNTLALVLAPRNNHTNNINNCYNLIWFIICNYVALIQAYRISMDANYIDAYVHSFITYIHLLIHSFIIHLFIHTNHSFISPTHPIIHSSIRPCIHRSVHPIVLYMYIHTSIINPPSSSLRFYLYIDVNLVYWWIRHNDNIQHNFKYNSMVFTAALVVFLGASCIIVVVLDSSAPLLYALLFELLTARAQAPPTSTARRLLTLLPRWK